MSDYSAIPPDMWKVTSLLTIEETGEEMSVMFHAPPMVIFHALILRRTHTDGKKEISIPEDFSEAGRLRVASACVAAIFKMQQEQGESGLTMFGMN